MINENVLRNLGVIIHTAIFFSEKKGWNNDYKAVRKFTGQEMQYHMDQKSLKVQFLTLQNPTIQKGKKS